MRLTRELGYPYHSFCADVLDPFFSGDRSYQMETAAAVRRRQRAIRSASSTCTPALPRTASTGSRTATCRARADAAVDRGVHGPGRARWARRGLAATGTPSRWRRWRMPREGGRLEHGAASSSAELAEIGRAEGPDRPLQRADVHPKRNPLDARSVGSLPAGQRTARTAARFASRSTSAIRRGCTMGCPGPTSTTGSGSGVSAPAREIIHLQQTTADASHHWPFTPAYNERGHVRIEAVLEALGEAHRSAREAPDRQPVPPVCRGLSDRRDHPRLHQDRESAARGAGKSCAPTSVSSSLKGALISPGELNGQRQLRSVPLSIICVTVVNSVGFRAFAVTGRQPCPYARSLPRRAPYPAAPPPRPTQLGPLAPRPSARSGHPAVPGTVPGRG